MSRPKDLNVYIYLRKSRKDLEEEKKSIENDGTYDTLQRHRETLFAIAKNERHNIIEIYEEVVSGESVTERPQIQEMLRSFETQPVDAVLVMDLDRLGRGDMLDQGLLDRAFRYSSTKILTPTEVYDPKSETWELVFGIKSLVAREELKAITRRMQRGRVASAKEGKSITKIPPYGYSRDENLRLYPDVETAWVVKKMFEMMRDGYGRIQIAHELDKLGIKPPSDRSTHWAPSSITAIIKNEVYIGNIIWGQIDYVKRNGKYIKNKLPREEWTIKEDAHEPIVSRELFEQANRAHSGRWRPSTVATKRLSNPLAGILKCELCGYTMLYQPRKDRPNNVIRCTRSSCKGKQKGASMALVEEKLIDVLKEIDRLFEVEARKTVKKKDDTPHKKILIEKIENDVKELTSQKNRLHDFLEQGVYDIETFMERQKNIVDRIQALQEKQNNLLDEVRKEEIQETTKNEFRPKLRSVISAYERDGTSVERKNELLKSILLKVTYLREKDWNEKDKFKLKPHFHI